MEFIETPPDFTDTLGLTSEPEKFYTSLKNFNLDYNMLNYAQEDDNGFSLDWGKLVYGDDQINKFIINKQEKLLNPSAYNYLFDPNEKTPFEKWILEKEGYEVPEIKEEDIKPIILAVAPICHEQGATGAEEPVKRKEVFL